MKNNIETTIYWTKLECDDWSLQLAATSNGLCYVDKTYDNTNDDMENWLSKRFKNINFVKDDSKFIGEIAQLEDYFSGNLKQFNLQLDYDGTQFQKEVWGALLEIPYGETWTYSNIANKINRPKAVRAVGAAIGANPLLIIIPCHRIIGKDGSLTGFRSGIDTKIKLLELEKTER